MRFPYFASGKVVKGFGRGSKQLKIPTANFSEEIVEQLPQEYIEGVYFGWARVNNGGTFKMVMSIGKNPYFNNTRRTMETHIMHNFEEDFYDSNLRILIVGYIRPMSDFKSMDDLINAIHKDIQIANTKLDLEEHSHHKSDERFLKVEEIHD